MRHARRLLGAIVAAAAASACSEVGTDPDVPVAIEIVPPILPAIAEGDTLRDTLGTVQPVLVRVLNSQNQVIPNAPVRFFSIRNDSILAVDSITGNVAGLRVGEADVVARVNGLQSIRLTMRVTPAPDTVAPASALVDSVLYGIADDTARALAVTVLNRATTVSGNDTIVPVPFWRVRYTIVDPPDLATNTDTTRVYIAHEASNRLSRVDTTGTNGTNGVATRRLRFPTAVVSDLTRRTFVTEVVVLAPDGSHVAGSPLLFTTVIRVR